MLFGDINNDPVKDRAEKDLAQLESDASYAAFRPLLQKLRNMLSTGRIPPEFIVTFINVVEQMASEVQHGRPLGQVVGEASNQSGSFSQPDWDVNNVYQNNGQSFYFVLNSFLSDLPQEEPRVLLPIVLLVVTRSEAEQMVSHAAFAGYPEGVSTDFEQLQALLRGKQLSNWIERYGTTPQEWRPFPQDAETIEQLFNRALGLIEGVPESVIPEFYDIRTLNDDAQRRSLQRLREQGCVVVMDVISMRHPTIQREFRRSLLDAFSSTLVAKVAPVPDALRVVQNMLIVIEQRIDLEFYKRRMAWDARCKEVSQLDDFGTWLKDKAPDLLPKDAKAKSGIRQHYYK